MAGFNYHYFLLPVLSGVLLALSYPPYNVKFFLWVALVPLLIFINFLPSRKKIFWAGFLTGLIFLGSVISWFFSAYPADWMNVEKSPLIFSFLILVWLVNASSLAIFIALFSYFLKILKTNRWFDVLLIPSLWIIFEYLRSWSFGILWLGKDSFLGPHWTVGFLGYGLADSKNLLPLAGLAGIYGLSFLAVLINGLVYFIVKKFFENRGKLNVSFYKNLAVLILVFIFFNVSGAIMRINKEKNEPSRSLDVALLQTKFPSNFEYNSKIINSELNVNLQLLNEAASLLPRPDLIIFPEDSRFLTFLSQEQPSFNLQGLLKNNPTTIIDSSRVETSKKENYFQLYYFNSQKGLFEGQKKSFLMPGGEYFPYLSRFIIALTGPDEWLDDFDANREYKKGTNLVLGEHQGVKIGTLFCPEIFSPELYRKITNLGAEVLVNISGHGIFRGSSSLLSQVRAAAKVRAVENNRYLAQVINYNLSSIIDNQGNIIISGQQIDNEVISGKVFPIAQKTLYDKYADWILIVAILFVVFAVLLKKFDFFEKRVYYINKFD